MEQLPIDLSDLVPSELRVERPEVLPDRDGYSAIRSVLQLMKSLPKQDLEALIDPDAEPPAPGSPEASRLLLLTKDIDDAFRVAVGLPFVFPRTGPDEWNNLDVPCAPNELLFDGKQLARMMLRRASVLVREGREEEGIYLGLDILHLAQGLKAGHALMIGYMVGAAYEAMATAWLHRRAAEPERTAQALRSMLDGLPAYSAVDTALLRTYQTEFNDFLLSSLESQTLAQLAKGADEVMFAPVEVWPREGDRLLSRRETAEGAVCLYLAAVKALLRPYPHEINEDEFSKLWLDLPRLAESSEEEPGPSEIATFQEAVLQVDNALGKQILANIGFYGLSRLSMKLRTDIEALKARAAVRLYELEHGSLPADLETVVSAGLLRALPMDPAAGKPLMYDSGRRLVWGAGVNGRDDGGTTGGHAAWPMQLDLVYEL